MTRADRLLLAALALGLLSIVVWSVATRTLPGQAPHGPRPTMQRRF